MVVRIRSDGDAVTNIPVQALAGVPTDVSLTVECAGHTTVGLFPEDHGQPPMTFVAVKGGDEYLRLVLAGDNAGESLQIEPGAAVVLRW